MQQCGKVGSWGWQPFFFFFFFFGRVVSRFRFLFDSGAPGQVIAA
jgi:hypothetical protein